MSELRTELQGAFVDLGHKKAFDLLVKAWSAEQAAMGNSTLPTVGDKLNILANGQKTHRVIVKPIKRKGYYNSGFGK
jgi:hypothetical protein